MADVKVRGMSTTYTLVSKLFKVLSAALPIMLPELNAAERAVVVGLLEAMRLFLEQAPFPGSDNDPGTQA